jgi:hypothetical protein
VFIDGRESTTRVVGASRGGYRISSWWGGHLKKLHRAQEGTQIFGVLVVLSLPSINTTSGDLCHFDVIWYLEFDFPNVGLSTRKNKI